MVVSLFSQFDLEVQFTADGYDEGTGVVGTILAVFGQYKIRKGKECSFGFLLLLPQARYRRVALGSMENNLVFAAVGGKDGEAGLQEEVSLILFEPVEPFSGFTKESIGFLRFQSFFGRSGRWQLGLALFAAAIVGSGIAGQTPGVEEIFPVDEGAYLFYGKTFLSGFTSCLWCGRFVVGPVGGKGLCVGLGKRNQRVVPVLDRTSQFFLFLVKFSQELLACLGVEPPGGNNGNLRGIAGVNDRTAVQWRNFTAVCSFDVVAPPTMSGIFMPAFSMASAMWHISSSEGVMRPLTPMMSTFSRKAVSMMVSVGTMTPRSMMS